MNKEELIESISSKLGSSKAEAERAIDAFVETVTNVLTKGDSITITGFGTFTVSKRAARQGVNPRSGEKIQIPAMTVPKFKAGKSLKDAVR